MSKAENLNIQHFFDNDSPGSHMEGDLLVKPFRCNSGHWHVCVEDSRGHGMAAEISFPTRGLALAAGLDLAAHLFPDRVVNVADDDDLVN